MFRRQPTHAEYQTRLQKQPTGRWYWEVYRTVSYDHGKSKTLFVGSGSSVRRKDAVRDAKQLAKIDKAETWLPGTPEWETL